MSIIDAEKRLLTRNKWTYSLGGIGRDMIYQLVATFLIVYIQFSGLNLTPQQFSVVGVLLVIGRVFDAINDPMMGGIVENTRSRWGKFKPWILIGALMTGVVVISLFTYRPINPDTGSAGWSFVIFFGFIYIFWTIFYTMNDIPYWSLLPNLSREKKDRDQIAMLVVVFAGVGAFLANAIVSFTTVGNAVKGYRFIAIGFVIFFIMCTLLTVIGVREPRDSNPHNQEKVTVKQMFRSIKSNDQLLWSALALLLYTIGSGLLVALGYNFFYMELGYNGTLVLIFIATFGVSNIGIQSFYAKLAKKFTRRQLMRISFYILASGYVLLLLLGYVPFLPVHILTLCLFGALVFGGQAIFYMVIIVNLTNTIEYNEYNTGKRNEAILFSLRPFVTKLASALQQGIVTLVLVVSGIFMLSQNVSQLEAQKSEFDNLTAAEQTTYIADIETRTNILDNVNMTDSQKTEIYDALQLVTFTAPNSSGIREMIINNAADSTFKDKANPTMHFILRLSISVLPLVLILVSHLIFKYKYKITEEYYDNMVSKLVKKYDKQIKSSEEPQ